MENSANQPGVDTRFQTGAQRWLSVGLSTLIGSALGYFIGKTGDSQNRVLGRVFGAVFGGSVGMMISLFSTKGSDLRPYDYSNEPDAIRKRANLPAREEARVDTKTQIHDVIREGRLEETAKDIAR